MFKRVGGCALRYSRTTPLRSRHLHRRKFSSSPSSATASPSPSAPFGGLTVELDRVTPRFEVDASQIKILDSPSAFYEALKDKIRKAKKRIYLSTLYIGKTEFELISTLNEALRNNPDLKVSILTDALRGTRETPDPSCASLLASLVAEHGPDRVQIWMFHTPNLTGLRKKVVPKRINEGWGLQHMKLYGVDDEIILSGANLSNDYFTNRLDRYHVFNSKQLTDYYARIHDSICRLSFRVLPDPNNSAGYLMDWPKVNGAPSPLNNPEEFISHASKQLNPLIQPPASQSPMPSTSTNSTFVYPVAQFTPLLKPDTSTEYDAVTSVLRLLTSSPTLAHCHWLFTAGYFNIHPTVSSLLVSSVSETPNSSKPQGTVLTASPWANGFYGSPGVSGMLPAAYTHFSARFLDRVAQQHKTDYIQLEEWRRGTVGEPGGWTYHAKGLWINLPGETNPTLTFVGSSNYTKRSYSLDLEVGALVVTADEDLKRRLGEETAWLQKDSKPITREDLRKVERRVGWNVRLSMWLVKVLGGAF